jgi:hypothetical protein
MKKELLKPLVRGFIKNSNKCDFRVGFGKRSLERGGNRVRPSLSPNPAVKAIKLDKELFYAPSPFAG